MKRKTEKLTAHMSSSSANIVRMAADTCELTDSEYAAGALVIASRLRLMRVTCGWRRFLCRQWWQTNGRL